MPQPTQLVTSTRSLHYLRISKTHVLPLILYLPESNLTWFTDEIFQQILASLQPIISSTFETARRKTNSGTERDGHKEKDKKDEKDTVVTLGSSGTNGRYMANLYRGAKYQFAYFFRPTTRHVMLSKTEPYDQHNPYTPMIVYKYTLVVVAEPHTAQNVRIPQSSMLEYPKTVTSGNLDRYFEKIK